MSKHVFDLPIRVLIYEEDGETVAHGLEMDLLGYGKNQKEALAELLQCIVNQVSFAAFKEDPGMVYFPAEKDLFARWEKAHTAQLKGLLVKDKSSKVAVKAVAVSVPFEKIEEARKSSKYARNRAAVCA